MLGCSIDSVGPSGWPIFTLLDVYNCVGLSGFRPIFSLPWMSSYNSRGSVLMAYFYIASMFYNSVGPSLGDRPIFSLLGCSIYNCVGLSGWPIFTLLCSITVQGLSCWPIFSLLGCSITVWVRLGGLYRTLLGMF